MSCCNNKFTGYSVEIIRENKSKFDYDSEKYFINENDEEEEEDDNDNKEEENNDEEEDENDNEEEDGNDNEEVEEENDNEEEDEDEDDNEEEEEDEIIENEKIDTSSLEYTNDDNMDYETEDNSSRQTNESLKNIMKMAANKNRVNENRVEYDLMNNNSIPHNNEDDIDNESGEIEFRSKCYLNLPGEFQSIHHILDIYQRSLNEKMDLILNKVCSIEDRLTTLESLSKINFAELDGEILTLKEIKNERLDISEQDVFRALVYKDYRTILYIFKMYYGVKRGKKIFYPIRPKSAQNCQYFFNNQWIDDRYGNYTCKTLFTNIQNLFFRYNIFSKKMSQEEWFSNQQFILKLSEEKYRKSIFKSIMDEIINNNC